MEAVTDRQLLYPEVSQGLILSGYNYFVIQQNNSQCDQPVVKGKSQKINQKIGKPDC